ncbi:MAG TPA: hypothetical protein PLY70_09260 [Saprospiraceae bacterium]|nr:hypothetical protein [Saprospiraceae bacterium]HPN71515.1 hypothetical protein [Saprospiraceae bacterium]
MNEIILKIINKMDRSPVVDAIVSIRKAPGQFAELAGITDETGEAALMTDGSLGQYEIGVNYDGLSKIYQIELSKDSSFVLKF